MASDVALVRLDSVLSEDLRLFLSGKLNGIHGVAAH